MSEYPLSSGVSILLVDDDPDFLFLVKASLTREGFDVTLAHDGREALNRMVEATPDLIISDVMMPLMDGFEMLKEMRENPKTASIPVIMLTARAAENDVVNGISLGADDYLSKPFSVDVLLAKVRSKLSRPPVPVEGLLTDRQTGLMSTVSFQQEASREILRTSRGGKPGCLAFLEILETTRYCERLGERADREITRQISDLIQLDRKPLEIVGRDPGGRFLLLIPEADPETSQKYLDSLAERLGKHKYSTYNEVLNLTPVIGYTIFSRETEYDEVERKARVAMEYAVGQMDLQSKVYDQNAQAYFDKRAKILAQPKETAKKPVSNSNIRTILQVITAIFFAFFAPLVLYIKLDSYGMDITPYVYLLIVISLLITAAMIWVEGFQSLKKVDPPESPDCTYPPASAIIAAYLPNEAYTIAETVRRFLSIQYPGKLQIILAYNTPRTLTVEETLHKMAKADPRLTLLRVDGSESKSQNVNAAISYVTGEFVGVFDADHLPEEGSFQRAWRWLSNGYDVVQGHCLVRNHDASWLARMVAVEFEAIYAVSHPGRTRLYGFGIFGGSNGYWKTDLLRQTRMHGFMLTEDIDSSMRITENGYKIATDPKLISRELAPGTVKALWNQRMRWSQGWFQVSREHFLHAVGSKNLTTTQKFGATYLLAWREVYPWISTHMFPIIAFWVMKYGGINRIDWLVPIFVMTTLFTLSVGPGQALLAYINAEPEIKQHKSWFWEYLVFSSLFYTEFKNTIVRVAQIKEFMGEHNWRITPRPVERADKAAV